MASVSDDPGTLPLVVWLKGDESYFDHFSMDAESVMKQLGIKRSRLRQISGQELRVGRKRVDRYVRPVYRPEDVEQYLDWTRATASHKKSSGILQQAVNDLNGLSGQIQETFSRDILKSLSAIEKSMLRISRYSAHEERELQNKISDLLLSELQEIRHILLQLSGVSNHIHLDLRDMQEKLRHVSRVVEISQTSQLEDSQAVQSMLRLSIDSSEQIRKIACSVRAVLEEQAEQAAAVESLTKKPAPGKTARTGRVAAKQLIRRKNRPALAGAAFPKKTCRPRVRLTTRFS